MHSWSSVRNEFIAALRNSIRSVAELERLVRTASDQLLADLVSMRANLVDAIAAVVSDAERGNWIAALLKGALEIAPQNRLLLAVEPKVIDSWEKERPRSINEIPLDVLPPVAYHVAFPNMPYQRNPHFVGREKQLLEIAKVFYGGEDVAIGQAAVTGMGGIGKTQLVVEFVYRYGRYFAGACIGLTFQRSGCKMSRRCVAK